MSNVVALHVHIIQVTDNFVHLHTKLLNKLKNNYVKIKVNNTTNYASSFSTPFNTNGENALNVSASFAKTLKVDEFDVVIVSNAEYMKSLKTAYVSPVSVEDLQILETSADTVQSVLLNQIRIIQMHQILNVWVMKSFSIKIHIDRLDHGLTYGKIEEYSEVIVAMTPNECNNCILPDNEYFETVNSISSPWNFIKNVFSYSKITNETPVKTEDNFRDMKFINGGIFRCTLTPDDFPQYVQYYPYNVFIAKHHCPLHYHNHTEGYSLCSLFLFTMQDLNDEEIIEKTKHFFQNYLDKNNCAIINNDQLFALDYYAKNILQITFNPVALYFVELNQQDLDSCNFSMTRKQPGMCIDENNDKQYLKFINFSFQRSIIEQLKNNLFIKLRLMRIPMNDDMENCNHIILEGDYGTGKSYIIDMLSQEVSKLIFVKKLECKILKGKLITKLEKIIESALTECVFYQPAILCLDDLDMLFASSKRNTQQQSEPSVSSYTNRLSHMLSDLFSRYLWHHVTIFATARSCTNFEPSLLSARGSSTFSRIINIPTLNQEMREECFIKLLSCRIDHNSNIKNISDIVQRTEGYCIQDLSDLVDKIYFELLKRQDFDAEFLEEVFEDVFNDITPLALIGIDLHRGSPVSWKDIGGLDDAKQLLTELLIWPSQFPTVFDQCPLKMQSGVLLYGAPGSGKTLLASAVAGESGLNFVSIKGPELLSKFVGESEEGVRNIFRKAQNAKPCILFFDEFDSLAPRRGNDITGVTDRVVNQLLAELDGVETVSGVWVLAATSRPDLIDPALLRPGRLGTTVYCSLPNQDDRCSIFKVLSSSIAILGDVDFSKGAEITEGYTGADLRAVLYTASMKCDTTRIEKVRACLRVEDESPNTSEVTHRKIDTKCLIEAIHETRASLRFEERITYEKIYKVFQRRDGKFELPSDQKLTYA